MVGIRTNLTGNLRTTKERTILILAALALIGLLTLWPLPGQSAMSAATPFLCLPCGPNGGSDLLLNVLLFVPLGVGLALRPMGVLRATLLCAGVTGLVEMAQWTLVPGRDSSAADLLANTVGGALGAWLGLHWRRLLFVGHLARVVSVAWAAFAFGVVAVTAWSLRPSLPATTWYAQWAPFGNEPEWFEGSVLQVELGHEPLPHWRQSDSEARRARLLNDTLRLAARIVTAAAPREPVRIVAVADSAARFVTLSQVRRNLDFSLRTRAASLYMHSPEFRVPDALPSTPGDTVVVEGRYWHGWVAVNDRRFEVSGMDGWTLFLAPPVGSRLAMAFAAVWLLVLFAPIGWFGGQARSPSWAVAPGIAVLMGSLVIAGYTVTPLPGTWHVAVAALATMAGRVLYAAAEPVEKQRGPA